MIDHRIYATVYSVCILAYVAACVLGFVTIHNDRAQAILHRVVFAAGGLFVLTCFAQYQDWLWS